MASLEALDEVMVPGATLPEPATAPEAAMLGMVVDNHALADLDLITWLHGP